MRLERIVSRGRIVDLRSLDLDEEETDEFQRILAQPFLSRVVRPIAGDIG